MAVVGAEGASSRQRNGVHIFKGGNKSLSDHIVQNQQAVQSSLGIWPFPASSLLPSQVPHLQSSFKSPPLTKVRDEFERKPMGCIFSIVSASCFR